MYSQFIPSLWHPAGDSRLYESSGSRTAFLQKWNTGEVHQAHSPHEKLPQPEWLELTMQVLQDEDKLRWLG